MAERTRSPQWADGAGPPAVVRRGRGAWGIPEAYRRTGGASGPPTRRTQFLHGGCAANVSGMAPDAREIRDRLARARLLLLFTPELCAAGDPLAVLDAAAPWVDLVQIRPKNLGAGSGAPAAARDTWMWCRRALELEAVRRSQVLVTVDDRSDVALALWERGCAGVHLGHLDQPARDARAFLGDGPLIGVSTHDLEAACAAEDLPIDYVGFGPIHPTGTKGYARGLGAETAWIAAQGVALPLFPIGGIDLQNAGELARVGRAAVGSAILASPDPADAARALRALLTPDAAASGQ